jgi:antitoxin component YwqK of YwqJK toxin-antitoxin module
MKQAETKYGVLEGVSYIENYDNGQVKACILEVYNELETPYGKLVPQYEEDHVRRKYGTSVSFHENGNIKTISLNSQTDIDTLLGTFPAEKITFYEDETLHRLFPVNGKLTGYWTEENEYTLASEHVFKFSFGQIKSKMMSIQFYPSQQPKSITLWPKERVMLELKTGKVDVRTGIALYESGEIKSCEPAEGTVVDTPIGSIVAYDTSVIGIHGESNSLQFRQDGQLSALATSTDKIEIYDENSNKVTYAPQEVSNLFNPNVKDIMPLYLAFSEGKVIVNDEVAYNIDRHTFVITHYFKNIVTACTDCSNCNLCQ